MAAKNIPDQISASTSPKSPARRGGLTMHGGFALFPCGSAESPPTAVDRALARDPSQPEGARLPVGWRVKHLFGAFYTSQIIAPTKDNSSDRLQELFRRDSWHLQ